MKAEIRQGALRGTLDAIPSKSDVHRLLICAALAQNESSISIRTVLSDDIHATMDCLRALGSRITEEENGLRVKASLLQGRNAEMNCRESGSTLRFLLPVAAATGNSTVFFGEGRLMKRPLAPLLDLLDGHGCRVERKKTHLSVSGRLCSGKYCIPGNISSQFITGLLLALPLLDGDSRICLTSPLVSAPYVSMTLHSLRRFGIKIIEEECGFLIPGEQKYLSPGSLQPEGDWSSAAFWLCAGALGGDVTLRGLDTASCQGDREALDVFREMGAQIRSTGSHIRCSGTVLRPVRQDLAQIPDLGPVLALAAGFAKGESVLYNAHRLAFKECDRLEAVRQTLWAFGIRTELENGALHIFGGAPAGCEIPAFADHRMVLSAAIAAAYAGGRSALSCTQAANKSYPGFFDDFKRLGGKLQWLP